MKSPGIKTRSHRFPHIDPLKNIANTLSGGITGSSNSSSSSNSHHHHSNNGTVNANKDFDSVSLQQQVSPSTPLTPPHSAATLNHHHGSHYGQQSASSLISADPVFAPVMIGGVPGSTNGGSLQSPSALTPSIHNHHHHASSSSAQNFFPSNFMLSSTNTPTSSHQHVYHGAQTLPDFSLRPPPLPPRTYRRYTLQSSPSSSTNNSPRTRPHPPHLSLFSRDVTSSPPPLPPRSCASTTSSSASLSNAPPPPLPPHSGTLSHHHQRYNSDIVPCSPTTLANGGVPIVRRNSTLDPLLPRRSSQGGGQPLSPLHPITPTSPHHTPVVPLSPASTTSTLCSSHAGSSSPTISGNVPELPPKTYRQTNGCH